MSRDDDTADVADPELYLQGKRYVRDVALPRSPSGAEGMVGVTILVPLEVQESEGAALKHCRAMATQYGLSLDELLRYSPTMPRRRPGSSRQRSRERVLRTLGALVTGADPCQRGCLGAVPLVYLSTCC